MALSSFLVVLYVFLAYWLLVLILERRGVLQRHNITAFGPILMLRTKRGQRLLETLAGGRIRRKFWRCFANFGISLVIISMISMFILLILSFFMMLTTPPAPSKLSEPRNMLLIPGINEFIPLYGWVGLVIALVAHEISHAVLCKVEGIRVKSMGIILALIPIGGFAEPDSEQLFGKKAGKAGKTGKAGKVGKAGKEEEGGESGSAKEDGCEGGEGEASVEKVATAKERTRILAAGVTSNFCVAALAFLLFFAFLAAIQPVSESVPYVYSVAPGSPAERAGLKAGMLVLAVDGVPVRGVEDLKDAFSGRERVALEVLDENGTERTLTVEGGSKGVWILQTFEGFPAERAGIRGGMCIIAINGTTIGGFEEFLAFMNQTHPGQTLRIRVQTASGETKEVVANLTTSPYGEKKGFLGVVVANMPFGMAVAAFPTEEYLNHLRGIPASLNSPEGWLRLTALPFLSPAQGGFNGFSPLLTHFYKFPFAPQRVAFLVADVIFWTAWINFWVALFNCLPAIPLDGGYVFQEVVKSSLVFLKEEQKREKISRAIATVLSISIFFLIFFSIVRPYIPLPPF
ncbi:MAG: site-2 protease family protein [Candidatus Methanospirare jalkutatii]|nr:site-2 protease family protein [Candidatus Methanospirare jalkutatii]